jgi:hypothetical protein
MVQNDYFNDYPNVRREWQRNVLPFSSYARILNDNRKRKFLKSWLCQLFKNLIGF